MYLHSNRRGVGVDFAAVLFTIVGKVNAILVPMYNIQKGDTERKTVEVQRPKEYSKSLRFYDLINYYLAYALRGIALVVRVTG